ncbi:MAG: exo-alpha-sialidase [Actinomycetota bacterium]
MRLRTFAVIATVLLTPIMGRAASGPSIPFVEYQHHGFGVAVSTPLGVMEFGREGYAAADNTGRIVSELQTPAGFRVSNVIYDSQYDDRNVAGGRTPSGAIVLFFGRFDNTLGVWIDVGFMRSTDGGFTWSPYEAIPLGADYKFSPYGPLVVLPSGRLLQTVYGTSDAGHDIQLLASDDDGQSWRVFSTVVRTSLQTPTEAACVLIDGTSDANARLLLIARTATYQGATDGLRQYESSDGGATWIARGRINDSSNIGDVSPWLVHRPDGNVVLVWADRSTCVCLKEAVTSPENIWGQPQNWPASIDFYSSRLNAKTHTNPGNFGYPSIVDSEAVFYDIAPYDSGAENQYTPANTEFVAAPLAE